MLAEISLLTCLAFSALYPFYVWINYSNPIYHHFHRFHLGLPAFIGSIAAVWLLFLGHDTIPLLRTAALIWQLLFLGVIWYYWNKADAAPKIVSVFSLLGVGVFLLAENTIIHADLAMMIAGILGGLILAASLYTMNLGHFYLNVHGLPLKHLSRATTVFGALLFLRLIWDIAILLTQKIYYQGESIRLFQFLWTMDGFLLNLALFFGTLFPFVAIYFVHGTLKVKSTQSATGILYVILSAVLIGDITYKFYLIKFALPL